MSISIRLARGGAKKRPVYRIVVAETRAARDGKFIEKLGTYNPLLPKDSADRVTLNAERAKHWLNVGAVPSDRVSRFLDAAGLMKREASVNPNKAKPGKNAIARADDKAKKVAAAEAAIAEAAAKPAVVAPAEVAPAEAAPAEAAPADAAAE